MATSDVVVCQGAPQLAQLVSEAGEPTSDDGVHIEGLYLVRILGDKVAQLVPQLQDRVLGRRLSLGLREDTSHPVSVF